MFEHRFQCPFCWEEISLLLDPGVRHQNYVEDCGICCNPLEVTARFGDGQLIEFEVRPAQ